MSNNFTISSLELRVLSRTSRRIWLQESKTRNTKLKTQNFLKNERGFIFPTMVLFVFYMAISGMSYMHLRGRENLLVLNKNASFSAFELASAGIERSRATFKIQFVGGNPDWTPILQGANPNYPTDASPDPLLCPDTTRGCVIAPFQTEALNVNIANDGDVVTAPDIPFGETFDAGSYTVRAFNNVEDPVFCAGPGTTDCDGIIIYRALGSVRGEQKIIEIQTVATSLLDLLNCQGDPEDPCPEGNVPGSPQLEPMEDREPSTHTELPTLTPPGLTNPPTGYYSPTGGFAGLGYIQRTGDIILTAAPNPTNPQEVLIQDNTFYFTDGSITVKDSGGPGVSVNNIVVFGFEDVEVKTSILNNAIVIAGDAVRLQGGATLSAPLLPHHPAIITSGTVQADNNVTITGNLYAEGTVDLQPIQVHGSVIGDNINIQGSSSLFTDDGNLTFYTFMEGFDYPEQLQVTVTVDGTWAEIQ